jgi:hypothetical protein
VTRHSKSLQELADEPLDVALVHVPTYDVAFAAELGAGAECSMPQAVRITVAAITEISREAILFIGRLQSCIGSNNPVRAVSVD